ncbi:RhoGAP-domain-containing protein [Thelephora ganbajun]|uniref:RhoGAP-domain-containing protein n=1 Tax=Thelephora ganbajun TaxID=370292 RepID=A0ACB6ZH35_THEGA|nr:RhoGAP-domain-containing protein [Thelephora ganbajun]
MSSGPDVQKPTGVGPASTDGGGGSAALTLAGVLSSYTSTPNPPMAALERVISERNVLSSQNSQLWKLVEKQRSGYGQILKELERVRSERDTFKARLTSLGESPEQILKKQKASKGSHPGNALKPSSSHSGLRSDDQPKATPEDPRQAMTRHQSEDSIPRARLTPSPNDPARPTIAVRADSLGPSPTPPTLQLNTQPYSGLQPSSSAPILSPVLSVVSPALTSAQSFTTIISSPFTSTPPNSSLNIPPTSSGDLLQPNQLSNLPPQNGDPSRPSALSRESRVSLPEEAKRYMATIGESPTPSPLISSFKSKPVDIRSDSPSQISMSETKDDQTQANSVEEEFLDTDDSANDDNGTGSESSLSDGEFEEDKPSRSVEDFPMPPSSHPPVAPSVCSLSTAPDQASIHSGYTTNDTSTRADPTASTTSFQSSNPHSNNSQPKPRHRQKPSLESPASVQPHFRQLPLLVSDFPMTRVQVSHSSIRPNDRGKEVLSFVIIVDPGSGREPWKIEKFYSDFISLDQKTRSANRNLAKKMPSLPDSKLWRDHAPAKVDQRKVALENYLQTILSLPVKDRNEIAAFFTSDIVRARQPVASAGYKEGYLTKRGKNFGGWKRRYFVLQGTVLEYYESRGGAHLGSITITGAQIGRQQRAGTSQSVDEDNEYRHAFLIIETRKGQSSSSNTRHVLCAESDEDRDSWVDVLVRYVNGGYYDDQQPLPSSSSSTYSNGLSPIVTSVALASGLDSAQPRSSTSSVGYSEQTLIPSKQRGYPQDDTGRPTHGPLQEEGNSPLEAPISSSLPSSSPLDGDSHAFSDPWSQSLLGHDSSSDIKGTPPRPHHHPTNNPTSPPEHHRPKDRDKRRSVQPIKVSSGMPKASLDGRSTSPDVHTPRVDQNGKVKISGPIGGGPIPAGYKFGVSGKDKEKDGTEQSTPGSDRREKAKSKMFWGFGRPNEKSAAPAQPQPSRAVFGTTLEESLEVAQIANLPAIVFRCIQYLELKKADQEEGIYRLSGSSAVIKSLKDRFNMEGDIDLLASDEYWDPHAIAGLLKTFMRELPASILTRELHTSFLSVIDFVDAQERIKELSSLISQLPLANYSLLRALTAHLILIVQNSDVNKMTMRNVGIVFSPTLGIPAGVFSLMLGEFNRVFNVDESGEHGEDPDDSPARRNSRHYSDAAADKLLGLAGRSLKAPPEDSDGEDDPPMQEDNGADSADGGRGVETAAAINLKSSRASNIAASRGLNVNVSTAKDEPMLLRPGLPVSPRPPNSPHYSPSPTTSPMTALR